MNTIIDVHNLYKSYGSTVAVEDVSFAVHAGEIFGMVGPNGAGKTTTIECIEGLRQPDSGQIRTLGLDPQKEGHALKLRTGMQLQQSNLPDRMRVWETLKLYSSFYPQPADWQVLLERLGLQEKRNTYFSKLSGGQKQRLFIALALLPDPELVFLDELTTGLDPQARHAVWDLIREIRASGKTILLSTHFMEEAERLCDRVAILDHGRIVALDTPAALIEQFGGDEHVSFQLKNGLPASFTQALPQTIQVSQAGDLVSVSGDSGQIPLVATVVNCLTDLKIPFGNLRSRQPSLEDVFLNLTGRELKE